MSIENEKILDNFLQSYTDESSLLYDLTKTKLKEGLLIYLPLIGMMMYYLRSMINWNHKKMFQIYHDSLVQNAILRKVGSLEPLIHLFNDETYIIKLFFYKKCIDSYILSSDKEYKKNSDSLFLFQEYSSKLSISPMVLFLMIIGKVSVSIQLVKEGNIRLQHEKNSLIYYGEKLIEDSFLKRRAVINIATKKHGMPECTDASPKIIDFSKSILFNSQEIWKTKDIQLINFMINNIVYSKSFNVNDYLKTVNLCKQQLMLDRKKLFILLNNGKII